MAAPILAFGYAFLTASSWVSTGMVCVCGVTKMRSRYWISSICGWNRITSPVMASISMNGTTNNPEQKCQRQVVR